MLNSVSIFPKEKEIVEKKYHIYLIISGNFSHVFINVCVFGGRVEHSTIDEKSPFFSHSYRETIPIHTITNYLCIDVYNSF